MRFTVAEYCFTTLRSVAKRAHHALSAGSIDAELVASPLVLTLSPKPPAPAELGNAGKHFDGQS
ncbi:MAG: hypothetical protein JSR99_14360 [Proteobacteria bacterium]|nr:hypothetical protein [Pseudomonadota bacterium]